jgi:hypothetical protein
MPALLKHYDQALHDAPAPSVQMAQRLLAVVKSELADGQLSRDEIHDRLLQLFDYYDEHGCENEREAVADVLDSFEGWSPPKAAV